MNSKWFEDMTQTEISCKRGLRSTCISFWRRDEVSWKFLLTQLFWAFGSNNVLCVFVSGWSTWSLIWKVTPSIVSSNLKELQCCSRQKLDYLSVGSRTRSGELKSDFENRLFTSDDIWFWHSNGGFFSESAKISFVKISIIFFSFQLVGSDTRVAWEQWVCRLWWKQWVHFYTSVTFVKLISFSFICWSRWSNSCVLIGQYCIK